jgi:hypothetical protein
MIEGLLERARAGDVQSFVVVTADPGGHPQCEMAMDRGHATTIIGALRMAESHILKALEVTEECERDFSARDQ